MKFFRRWLGAAIYVMTLLFAVITHLLTSPIYFCLIFFTKHDKNILPFPIIEKWIDTCFDYAAELMD